MKKHSIYFSILLSLTTVLSAKTIKVPDDKPKIQTAINAASNGDTILVSPGIYYENVNFYNKRIVLTSHYIFNRDTSFIRNTVIDGSKPTHSDTASCILILKGHDSTTVVQGFTITGGQGTSWKDEHSGGTYREGGGIMVALSSPTIQYNVIVNNKAVDKKGLTGTGGGGIRCGDGSPRILNNVIINNTGNYGAGIVLNWCGAVIRNNIIAGNIGGEDYGGGGLWINNTNGKSNIIENNTIVNNHSFSSAGGILMYSRDAKAILKNNIIYGNSAAFSPQITSGANVTITNCNIDGFWTGNGNMFTLPEFKDSVYYLSNNSSAIDAGDTSKLYNDLIDNTISFEVLFPSLGLVTNDMGAYGGPRASIFSYFQFSRIGTMTASVSLGNSNVIGQLVKQKIILVNQSTDTRNIDSVVVMTNKEQLKLSYTAASKLKPAQSDSVLIEWTPTTDQQFTDTILVYHNAMNTPNPLRISVIGKFKKTTNIINSKSINCIFSNPNPFSSTTKISYTLGEEESSAIVRIYTIEGRILKTYKGLNESGSIEFDGKNLPEGIYLCRLSTANNKEIVNKMLVQH